MRTSEFLLGLIFQKNLQKHSRKHAEAVHEKLLLMGVPTAHGNFFKYLPKFTCAVHQCTVYTHMLQDINYKEDIYG